MPNARRRVAAIIATAITAAACSSTTPAPSPSPSAARSSPSLAASASASLAAGSATPSAAPGSAPPLISQILVRGSARELSSNPVTMSPALDGMLYLAVPSRASTVVTRFDSAGRSTAGWPVTLDGTASCDAAMPLNDGSVRMVCRLRTALGALESTRAFGFDARGRPLPGWPVDVDGGYVTGRLSGDTLHLLVTVPIDPQSGGGDAITAYVLVSIGAGGATARGRTAAAAAEGNELWGIGPDGVAYGVLPGVASVDMKGASRITRITAEGRGAGIPVDGVASALAFDPAGGFVLLSAYPRDRNSRVIRMTRPALDVSARSAPLPFAAADPQSGDTGGCTSTVPAPPQIGADDTILLYSDVDDRVLALDSSLKPAVGWPFELPAALVHPRPGPESEHEAGYCPGPLAPQVGPDGTVYLALETHTSSLGGSLVGIGSDGRVRAGWPVQLTQANAEFWSLVVGANGTVYTVAYEPSAGGRSTATLLAIAPDSTILYRTTIVAPG